MDEQPVVINEPADNAGAGATGDSTFFLRALLENGADFPTILTIVDPQTVGEAVALGVGNEGTFDLGGKINVGADRPVRVKARVRTIHDGRYVYTGEVMHGMETSMGRTCVPQLKKNIHVQVTELPVFTIDPEHYRCVGLHPERMKMVLIKSQGSYKAAYRNIARQVIYVDTPGLSRSNVLEIPYRRLDRQRLYPFNRNVVFDPGRDMLSYGSNVS